jgi:hypothetical protein
VAAADTTIALTSGQGTRFPITTTGNWFYCTLIDASGVLEIIKVTGRNNDILTCARGQDGTLARAFTAGSAIEARLVAAIFNTDLPNQYLPRDGSKPMLAALNMNSFNINNVLAPVAAGDATPMWWVQNQIAALNTSIANAMPRGAIIMWYAGAIPSGWQLCNGGSGTPNCYDRVPVAAGSGYGIGAAGGTAVYALDISQMPYHNHDGWTDAQGDHGHATSMDSQGAHLHNLPNAGSVQAGGDNGGAQCPVATGYSSGRGQNPTDYQGTHYHTISVGIAGNHGHNVGVGFRGSSGNIDFRQPYIALYFIQKMF